MIFLESPAKINLDLFITEKRQDGFHSLSTHMLAIDLIDHITIQESEENQLFSTVDIGPFETTLFATAYQALLRFMGSLPKVTVHLEKNIFIGAGLGGGSSNAATFLFGMNQLFSLNLSLTELQEIGSFVGSDVPFFFSSGFSLCKGRGEQCEKPLVEPKSEYWLIYPNISCLTKEVYSRVKIHEIDYGSRNHLMKFAFDAYPALNTVYEQSLKEDSNCWVTGSGSCIIFEKQPSFPSFKIKPLYREENQWYRMMKT